MATTKEYMLYVMEQLSDAGDVHCRPMMGEYVLYYRDKVIGNICDNRFLVKPVPAAVHMMPDAHWETPYEGAKDMLLVDRLEDRSFLKALLEGMYEELPLPKKKKKA